MTKNNTVLKWVNEMAAITKPDSIYWCNGSEEEKQNLIQQAVNTNELEKLNEDKLPGCYFHYSDKNDVARVEHLTFICTRKKDDAGITNNWMAPDEAYNKLSSIFDGSMKGRTLYVIPFVMGPANSPFSKIGIQLTDSIYVVLNMRIMTRMGDIAWKQLGDTSDNFTKCLHGKADLNPDKRFICHFPEDNTIWSVGSGYGGNALLGKKCLSLRIASWIGKSEGWMAEHMLILGIENPKGEIYYIAAAFPSQCGKTNLAMLLPPEALSEYKIWTVGDDIAWLRIGDDGRLWATNPEYGFFGVAPGTSYQTNPNAMKTIEKNTIFTNVVKKRDGTVWWEGMDENPPTGAFDWKGDPWDPKSGQKGSHPNARFTTPASQCPSMAPNWEDPKGVPISAIVFGGRRAKLAPLVFETLNWQHGTYVGASMGSETTAAATGAVGVVRRDPMAMLPFLGYNIADYFSHWISIGKKLSNPPKIFNVNWFRTDENGKFIWPGYGDNLRALLWIIERCNGKIDAAETPIGYIPNLDSLNTKGLNISKETLASLFNIDKSDWTEELKSQKEFFASIGDQLPKEIWDEYHAMFDRLK